MMGQFSRTGMKECSQNLHGSAFRGLDYHSELNPKNAPRLSGYIDEKSDREVVKSGFSVFSKVSR